MTNTDGMKLQALLLTAACCSFGIGAQAQLAAHFDMSLSDTGKITEAVTQTQYAVNSQLAPFTVEGLDGEALRFDGYSNYVKAALPDGLSTSALTLRVVLAAETYPMMQVDVAETPPTFTAICGNIDETAKKGFALELSSQGDLRFRYGSANGFLMAVSGTEKLPRGQWSTLEVTLDKADNAATLYLNGRSIGTGRMNRQDIAHSSGDFYIGKDATEKKEGPFLINTFCGLIDDISISNENIPPTPSEGGGAERPDFNYSAERYTLPSFGGVGGGSLWRPLFHGMPSGGWTNETHGMTYSDGRYHVFFQKNANGPYMSRLHWGHISSENLYDWREDPIAIAPGEAYDIKGCWSGCVFIDGGTPYILYTAVDNARATIAQAKALDDGLVKWEKQGVIINGRPGGLSDDFRDPYFLEANGQKYIIVGTSKNGIGACTLHRLQNGTWTNDGTIFFQGTSASQHGTFWEMPNITPMADGRWLFTCTPLGTAAGVRTLCWVGTIGTDGKFLPDGNGMQYLEMGGISRNGYGLLSPTISPLPTSPQGERFLLLGIVPDKLPSQQNFEMGWAHNYSLPREISLDANGQLVQKPYHGLTAMRSNTHAEATLTAGGTASLAPVEGRQLELLGQFSVSSGQAGFRFLKQDNRYASLTYDADRSTLTLDLTQLDRRANDQGTYNGLYAITMTEPLSRLHVYLDGSILDIFVNEKWAYSVRLFPTNAAQVATEVFATGQAQVEAQAWVLAPRQAGGAGITPNLPDSASINELSCQCYDLQGRPLVGTPQCGLYIMNGRKYHAGR